MKNSDVSQVSKVEVVNSGYKQRLSVWVGEQLAISEMTHRKLGDLLGVSYGSVQKWLSGNIKGRLSTDSIQAIATYRRMTPEQVKAWLEGREPKEALTLTEEIERLKKRVKLLEERNSMADLQSFRGPGAVVNLIRYEIIRQDFDPDDPKGLQEFLMCLPTVEDDEVAAIKALIQNRAARIGNDDWLFALALALSAFTGGFYNLRMLQLLDASAANGDRHVRRP